jgi:hypothetical protein
LDWQIPGPLTLNLTHNLGNDYTVPRRKNYHEAEEGKKRRRKKDFKPKLVRLFVVKKFCGSSLAL